MREADATSQPPSVYVSPANSASFLVFPELE